MRWTNYHSHSHFSDGKFDPEIYIQRAIELGLPAYGISDHGPFKYSGASNLRPDQVATYVRTIRQLQEKYSDQIQVYCAMEVDYIPDVMDVQHEQIVNANLDYTICSVHHAGFYEATQKMYSIDNSAKGLQKGIDELFDGDTRAMVEHYFALTRKMIQEAPPTILGHIDRIKKNNMHQPFFDEKESWYRAAVEATLDVIEQSAVIVEVNTKSFYKAYTTAPDPSFWIMEMIYERNIPIHLSSDTHHPDHITGAFEQVARKLKAIGFKRQRILIDSVWGDESL